MSKYGFVIEGVITMHLDVEADSLEAAVEVAQASAVMSLCHQCAHGNADEWSTSGELDCDPESAVLSAVYCDDEEGDLDAARKVW
jgi:hypothetical protein